MNHPDTALFLWMSAGNAPPGWLLATAVAIARGGAWLCVAVVCGAALREPHERGYLVALLAAAGLASLLSHAVAGAIGLQRPFVLGLSPAHIAHQASAALPSTHATVMGLIAFGMCIRPRLRRWFPAAAGAALATGWARVYVGVHFPSDIFAGFVLSGLLLGLFAGLLWLVRPWGVPAFMRIQQPAPEAKRLPPAVREGTS